MHLEKFFSDLAKIQMSHPHKSLLCLDNSCTSGGNNSRNLDSLIIKISKLYLDSAKPLKLGDLICHHMNFYRHLKIQFDDTDLFVASINIYFDTTLTSGTFLDMYMVYNPMMQFFYYQRKNFTDMSMFL